MTNLLRTLRSALRTARTAAVAVLTAAVCLVGLPATPASADEAGQSVATPVFITNGLWNDRMLCASPNDDSVWLKQFDANNPYCQWIQVGDRGRFLLFNPQKHKVASYLGGNGGAVVMENLVYPAPNQQLFSWGGWEDWNAYALQSYQDSGQNIDAKDPDNDNPRSDAVHTRGWRHGHQRELTWNALPVSGPSIGRAIDALQSYQSYLSAVLGSVTPNETACVTTATPLWSQTNGRYVSAELGYGGDQNGMLRARADGMGPWEQFNLCRNNKSNVYSIRSAANGRYVSAELGHGGDQNGMLRARADAIGPWEQFTIEPTGTGYAIRSAANGLYVSAEYAYSGDQNGMLRARANAIGPWEQFQ
ncbi:RICIN domain-containing protein [Kitasatospora sp. GP82]|uniref:fascin domain-containing protein n=1 Tax=Kitasatospora sp. GP82 TaxID=3035089 RepID=UPI002476D4BD|nr:RICIN domain-containing protein [Kitasatospora sp. GP82]MDH6127379.1 hypothetical protein [Kitasatospora sp. GP82]